MKQTADTMQTLKRGSGLILHPTSLPGPHGIGDLGQAAYDFVDSLAAMKQTYWQILPLGPTGYGNSPYMSLSAFGGNPLLIDLEALQKQGLLEASDFEPVPDFNGGRVDYETVIRYKNERLGRAAVRFFENKKDKAFRAYEQFSAANKNWLADYALFSAIKDAHGGRVWTDWPAPLRGRDKKALKAWRTKFEERVLYYEWLQYIFHGQWYALKRYCRNRGVRLIGDVPIYVAHDSADVWSSPGSFQLDKEGRPKVVAGVPPDYFSSTGQRWGNPIYRWDLMRKNGFKWWVARLEAVLSRVDLVRIDHFRGLEAYWEVPASAATAEKGRWVKGPGAAFFEAVHDRLGSLPFIAEDLGVITDKVEALRDQFSLPGMRVLQMAFSTDPKAADYQPHNYAANCAAYTATHDHNTSRGWFTAEPGSETTQTRKQIKEERAFALNYLKSGGSGGIHWAMIKAVWSSKAALAVAPLQDVMGLGSEARMNRPGRPSGNWQWRFRREMLTGEMVRKLADLTESFDRVPRKNVKSAP